MAGAGGRTVLAIALAGCYTAAPPAGVPCTPPPAGDGACPAGQECKLVSGMHVCAAGDVPDAQLDAPANDVDGDGVENAGDNCPEVANATQANEDLDRFGDACDPCPPFADSEPVDDPDGDGVSAPCDPVPAAAGDRIALFEGFATPLAPAWTAIGNWNVVDGAAVVIANDTGAVDLLAIEPPAGATDSVQVVVTTFTVLDLGNGDRALGPVQMAQLSPPRAVHCRIERAGAGPQLVIAEGDGVLDTTLEKIDVADFNRGQTIVITMVRQGEKYGCQQAGVQIDAVTPFAADSPHIGLRGTAVSARVPWILVLAR